MKGTSMDVFDQLATRGVVPVISIDDAKDALPLADALAEGGLPVAEITFRTPAAAQSIAQISKHRPGFLVGAGTVLNVDQVDTAMESGATFALSPGLDPVTVAHAQHRGLPFAPGIMTPSDLQMGLRAGCKLLKFFPAVPAGGVEMLRNIAAPYLHTGVRFNPTGGVTPDNMATWLGYAPVVAVGGTWIARSEDIAQGNWSKITENAAKAVSLVQSLRGT
jgi:2-dehydro-3-deoxyphosphogluconate aldolase/(4S)-4-hydroxy-2-oxoglutarate aldolase